MAFRNPDREGSLDLTDSHQQTPFQPSIGFASRPASYKPLIDEDTREIYHGRSISLHSFSTSDPVKRPPQTPSNLDRLGAWWVFDTICLLTSIICIVVIVVLMGMHNNKPLDGWTFYFSLNTIVSTLGTVARSSLVAAVSSSLAQGKWLWFKKRRSTLSDFDLLDSASRGPWGSLRLLWRADVRHLVSLGAAITILSLALGPMLQSAISYPGRASPLKASHFQPTSIGQALRLDGGQQFPLKMLNMSTGDGNKYVSSKSSPDYGIVAAINNGLANASNPIPLLTCSTGNCTWPIFASLAVCGTCRNVSQPLRKSSGEGFTYYSDAWADGNLGSVQDNGTMYVLGEGNATFHINNRDGKAEGRAEFMTAKASFSPNSTFSFKEVQSLLYAVTVLHAEEDFISGKIGWANTIVTATECALYLCVNAYNCTMERSQLSEEVVGSWAIKTPNSWLYRAEQPTSVIITNTNSPTLGTPSWSPIGIGQVNNTYVNRTDFQLTIPNAEVEKFKLKQRSFNATQRVLESTISYFSTLLPYQDGKQGSVMSRTDNMEFSDNIMTPLFESKNLTDTFAQIAQSMTTQFRSASSNSTQGILEQWQTYFHIRWGFLILPLGTIVGGCAFMLASIFETRKWKVQPWKSSELATLAYGLNERTRVQLRRAFINGNMEDEASMVRVQLLDSADGMELR